MRLVNWSGTGPRSGFTLVEMLVVLALVGLLLALAAPSLLFPARAPGNAVQPVIDAARRAAVSRAAAVTLSLGADGRWVLEGGGEPASVPLQAGTVDWPRASSLRLHISPLGACTLESPGGSVPPYTIDPVRCLLSGL